MTLSENLRPFYTAPLADQVVVKGFSIMAHFWNDAAEALGAAGTHPQLRVIAADVPGVIEGDSATVDGVAYTVRAVDPVGVGKELILTLQRI